MALPADKDIVIGYVIYDATNNLYICRRSLTALQTFHPLAMLYDTAKGAKMGIARLKRIADRYKASSAYYTRMSMNSYTVLEMTVPHISRNPV